VVAPQGTVRASGRGHAKRPWSRAIRPRSRPGAGGARAGGARPAGRRLHAGRSAPGPGGTGGSC